MGRSCILDPPQGQGDAYGSADARSTADACLSWQKVQGREANRRCHRLTEPTPKALCQPRPPPPQGASCQQLVGGGGSWRPEPRGRPPPPPPVAWGLSLGLGVAAGLKGWTKAAGGPGKIGCLSSRWAVGQEWGSNWTECHRGGGGVDGTSTPPPAPLGLAWQGIRGQHSCSAPETLPQASMMMGRATRCGGQ